MHYFQILWIPPVQWQLAVPLPDKGYFKGKKIPQPNQYGLTAGFTPHLIFRLRGVPADYTIPCPSIASTTFSNPAILAPAT